MPQVPPDPRVQPQKLPCGCTVGLAVQQAEPCRHNDGRYPYGEFDLEQVPCGCDDGCDRCNGHGYVYKKRVRA
jgi:hypothetical protein